jgi:hypothetical protein
MRPGTAGRSEENQAAGPFAGPPDTKGKEENMSASRIRVGGMCVWAGLLAAGSPAWGVGAEPQAAPLVIDGFEQEFNLLSGRSGAYQQAPSKVAMSRTTEVRREGNRALKLRYEKKGLGGPHDSGGWCGYWTLLKSSTRYFDASPYRKLTFWVRGQDGGEVFKVGLADANWDKLQDSVKSQDISEYLAAGKVTTEWQKAEVAFDAWGIDFAQVASVAIAFESENYANGEQAGVVYIDDLQFE